MQSSPVFTHHFILRASLRAGASIAAFAPLRRDPAQSFARLMPSISVTRDFKDHVNPMAEG